jgi:MFS family permease
MADVRDGLGPYLSVYLKGAQHWSPGDIGIAMAASSLSAALCQIPAGLLVDALWAKRMLVAGSGLAVAVGCILIATFPHLGAIIAAQVMIGAASAVIPPALAALSLGLVGRRRMDARISRNESFNHAGNFVAAILAGTLGQWLGYNWIFYLVCAFAAGSAAVVNLINSKEINHALARGGADSVSESGTSAQHQAIPIKELLTHRDLIVFLIAVVLFHFGNAAMLPMAGQVLARTHPGWDTISLSGCIIAAQLVMVAIAWGVGKAMGAGYGRKTIFLVALAVLPARGVLFSFTANPFGVIAIQLLDGVAAGIFGVTAIIIAADLTRGTGRFNLAQGLIALSVGLGAGMSNLVSGYIVQGFGYPVGFLSLAVFAAGALAFFALFMPETRDMPERRSPEVPVPAGATA